MEFHIMHTLITYDLQETGKHKIVKDEMKALGYQDTYSKDNIDSPLPNTTLWKEGIKPIDAQGDLEYVVKKCGGKLERFAAVEYDSVWAAENYNVR